MEILCYTREPLEDMLYANRLAYSMHLAYRREGEEAFTPFHHNEGILYAKAVQREDGTLVAKSLKNPILFERKEGGYGVAAIRCEAEGEQDQECAGRLLLWESDDLLHYREIGLVNPEEAGLPDPDAVAYDCDETTGECRLSRNAAEDALSPESYAGIEGCHPGNVLRIPDSLGEYLIKKLTVPVCERIAVTEDAGLEDRRAVAYYSDGTTVERKIDWNIDRKATVGGKAETDGEPAVDGKAETDEEPDADGNRVKDGICGRVHQEHFPFPFAEHRADPCCMYWHGKYYFIATNDADDNHTLYIRCADTLEGLINAAETLLLDSKTHSGIGGLLWAPEFHEIGGRMYIFHAATEGEFYREESRVMQLREGGDPMRREDWSAPKLVVKRDGTPLCEAGKVISLDMTTFEYEGGVYAMWSQRQFLPVDQGAWLYLARIDEREPWKLLSDPVCVALPEYGWENNHTFVVEGPYALWRDGQLMVTYSGAAVDATYAVGLLKPVMGSDLLDPANWVKSNYPLLSSHSADGEFGPGHNSYVTDENGLVWNFYHARPGVDGPRSSCARRVHFDVDGEPMLDVTEEMDLPEELRGVSC